MSQREKDMMEKIAALPEELQDKFLDKMDGATMAIDLMTKSDGPEKKDDR